MMYKFFLCVFQFAFITYGGGTAREQFPFDQITCIVLNVYVGMRADMHTVRLEEWDSILLLLLLAS